MRFRKSKRCRRCCVLCVVLCVVLYVELYVVLCEYVYSHAPPCVCKAGLTLFHSSFSPALQVL